jgi:diguanylate cyclase (GGDEF)-like protein
VHYKDKDAPAVSMTIAIKIAFLVYATIPIYIAAIVSYRRAPLRLDETVPAYLLVIVLVGCTTYDFIRLRTSADQLHPWFSFFQIALSIVIVADVNLTAGGNLGIYFVLFLLPILIASVMGDVTMIATTWCLSLLALAIVIHHKEPHHLDTLVWTLAVNGAAWGGAAMAIHVAVKQFLGSIHTAQTVSLLATEAQQVEEWPRGLVRVMPFLAEILDAEVVRVMAGPQGGSLDAVASFASGPGAKAGAPGPPEDPEELASGVRRAIDTRRVVDSGRATFVPNRTASGLDIVIVGIRRGAATLPEVDLTNAVVAAQLVAGIADRVSLIGGLREEALTDPLTGLANRRGLFDLLDRALGHASRTGEALSVVMLDLDHFKELNDEFGHLAGDSALRALGSILRTGLRQQDGVARFGGEEFCLVLPATDRQGAAAVLAQLQAAAARTDPETTGMVMPTFSAGVAEWDRVEDRQSLLRRADEGVYLAKDAGRNMVVTDQGRPPG